MPEILIDSVLSGKLEPELLIQWLNSESIEDTTENYMLFCCSKNEFVAFFLSYIRNQTESLLQTNSNVLPLQHHNTPEKIFSSRRKHRRSTSDPTKDCSEQSIESLSVIDHQRSHESPGRERRKTGKRVKTKLFNDEKKEVNVSASSDDSRLSTSIDRLALSSTPIKNGIKSSEYPYLPLTSPVTPHSRSFTFKEQYERCDTPRLSHRNKSQEKSCLGDYIVVNQKSLKKKRGERNVSSEADTDKVLDISNSEIFPEIGARKSSSLRSEKRRIKPTNLDSGMSHKSFSLSSFNDFQPNSPLVVDNSAFKSQKMQPKELANSFDAERNMLKQERHKLMEKFNILNTNQPATPIIKVIQNNSIEKKVNYIKADSSKVIHKDKVDLLVDIYNVLLKNNLILSINAELYYLISILLSKQNEEEYLKAENEVKNENLMNNLLKVIHNSTYFAVKSLWYQRVMLEVILDKNSLKILGENKKVRGFYPDLAKFLLNSYGIKCESDCVRESGENQTSAVVCFNFETDNADNFPSIISFQNFKKQRDMFYEIMRWYVDTTRAGGSRGSLRARVKTLLAHGTAPANHTHLAALFYNHMLMDAAGGHSEESKLSKLQRRLTCPSAQESNRLPHFTDKELFYKEFIIYTENESFRVHLRDTLASEIISLDSTPLNNDEKNSNTEITKEFLQLSKKLRLLSKFLGFLTSLPYCQVTQDVTKRTINTTVLVRDKHYTAPKEKVLENNIALRNYSQPILDLRIILKNAIDNGRLLITVPWIVHYLSMLDYTSLRINYYQNLLNTLFHIHTNILKSENLKKNTIIFLKTIMSWLFDLPHFPQELFYENSTISTMSVASDGSLDYLEVIDEVVLFELCPFLKDLNSLLSTSKVSQQKELSFRHITPVSLTLNPEDRMRNKEKELQSRLEEEFLKSQPSSTRRVLEVIIERTVHGCVKELAPLAGAASARARVHAATFLHNNKLKTNLLQDLQELYLEHLEELRTKALQMATKSIKERTSSAISALLPLAPAALRAVAAHSSLARLNKWMMDHWASTGVLCKDIKAEMQSLLAIGPLMTTSKTSTAIDNTMSTEEFDKKNVSVAHAIITLKEHIIMVLEGSCPPQPGDTLDPVDALDTLSVLALCAASCGPHNVFCRPPARRALVQLSVDLALVYVSRKPLELTDLFLSKLDSIWNTCCPDRRRSHHSASPSPDRVSSPDRNFNDDDRAPTPISDDERASSDIEIGSAIHLDLTKGLKMKGKDVLILRPNRSKSNQDIGLKIDLSGIKPSSSYKQISPMKSSSPNCKQNSPSFTLNSPNFKSNSPNYKSSSPNYKSSSPNYKSSSPNYKSSSPIYKSSSPSYKQNSPSYKQNSPSYKLGVNTSKSLLSPTGFEVCDKVEECDQYLEFFDRILCPRNLMILASSNNNSEDVWRSMADLLVFLLKNDYLTEDSLTEQCLAVYRQDWQQVILQNLSSCMRSVSSRWSKSAQGKFTLFLDFLAEYCADMDNT